MMQIQSFQEQQDQPENLEWESWETGATKANAPRESVIRLGKYVNAEGTPSVR
jgi:hypothetical protein